MTRIPDRDSGRFWVLISILAERARTETPVQSGSLGIGIRENLVSVLPEETLSTRQPRYMREATTYEAWQLRTHRLTGRSYLYSLPPIGGGTPLVESLTSYIQRLAEAHAVETGTLVYHELRPRVPFVKGKRCGQVPTKLPHSFYLEAYRLNGTGDRARLWVCMLEELTQVRRLDLLTALPWAYAINRRNLLRANRTWCSSCYENWRSSGRPVYEPLLWMLQVVTVCPDHMQPLDSLCPVCSRMQYVFSSRSHPGHCSRCRSWLGRVHEADIMDHHLAEHLRTAEMVADLLAASPYARNRVRWRKTRQINSLLKFCHSHNVSLIRALADRHRAQQ